MENETRDTVPKKHADPFWRCLGTKQKRCSCGVTPVLVGLSLPLCSLLLSILLSFSFFMVKSWFLVICCVFLCLLILLNLLCLWSPFCRLKVRSSCCFWCLSPVAKVGSVGCLGFLVKGTSACVLVDEAGSCLSGGQVHIWWCVLGCLWPYYDFRQPLC